MRKFCDTHAFPFPSSDNMAEKDACRLRYCLWLLSATGLYVGYGSGRKALQLLRISMAFLLITVGES